MKQVRVSDDAHAKIMNNFDKDLRTVWQVVDALIDRGDAVTVNKVNGVDEVNGVDVDYSQCPNCDKLQNAIYAQESTIEGLSANRECTNCEELGKRYDMAVKTNSDAHDEYVKLQAKCEELKNELEEARQNGGSDENCEGLKEQLEAQEDTITGKTTLIEGMEKTINDLTKDNDRLKGEKTDLKMDLEHAKNEHNPHLTGGK